MNLHSVIPVLSLALAGSSGGSAMTEGGIYSIDNGDGTFGVVKILKHEPGIVHVRVYSNKFRRRPTSVKVEQLSLGGINDDGGFGIGHLPIGEKDFRGWKAALLTTADVTDEELEGYQLWKEAGGGVFGR